ncbi:NADPH-dependent FMN reductase domain protein [Streptococcus ictaluri 707-05]|uniref:NADPH-dependent FMN reductase domain protein n=1 Tax=Streptococcus ictaluri 707-05 TaxID=764299 RepID=G5JZK1_9STRE|nr:NADPH-dependent FMN reductase domain protein [Streptococcus ictaluri 707-05]
MPFELTFADDNNQFLYYNNAHQDPETMYAKRVPAQVGNRMSTVNGSLLPARMKNVEWVIGTLRNGNQEYVRTIVPGSPAEVINTHNYQAMYYPDGSYAGINEIVFNFKPWLDWYLKETGQHLAGGKINPLMPVHAVDATSGASDAGGSASPTLAAEADAVSRASSH